MHSNLTAEAVIRCAEGVAAYCIKRPVFSIPTIVWPYVLAARGITIVVKGLRLRKVAPEEAVVLAETKQGIGRLDFETLKSGCQRNRQSHHLRCWLQMDWRGDARAASSEPVQGGVCITSSVGFIS